MTIASCVAAGTYLEWSTSTVDDAFGYAERRLGAVGVPIEPKDIIGVLPDHVHSLAAKGHKRIYKGIGWQDANMVQEQDEGVYQGQPDVTNFIQ